jgi:hypothetical protein
VAPERIIFGGRMRTPEHLARYRVADLFLDTSPYGAHTTASDALWGGLPVLTFFGNTFAARVCGSLVHAAGLHELVCKTPEHYVREAIRIGLDADLRHGLKQRLRLTRNRCTLFDTPNLVRNLEALFVQMWHDYCAGVVPIPELTNLPIYCEIGCEAERDMPGWSGQSDPRFFYESRMAYRHALSPIVEDRRFWTAPANPLARAA